MKTTIAKVTEEKQWYVVDATDLVLGRISVQIANVLRGKHKPVYTPNMDHGDHVIVINAEKVKVTGKKEDRKEYMHYTGYVGGERYVKLSDYRARKPEFLITHAVEGMLPKNKLASAMLKKLHVYAGSEHPHTAQQPIAFKF
ncbi:MAG: 50S ribosomal protein L13 [Opitutales bacterium]